MSLVTTKAMLSDAQRGGYAVGAFNVENMEMVQAVLEAAEKMQAPVIMQTTQSTLQYASPGYFYAVVSEAAENSRMPVALHLDHGSSFEATVCAVRAGYTSVMIDGSKASFEENVRLTQAVVRMCRAAGIPVEAELGKVGGKEDDADGGEGSAFTDPSEAEEFAARTEISSLAVAIGTAHGIYTGEPRLDLERLSRIRERVDIPLVLHGASGVADEAVQESIRRGICKVNFATELRIAYTEGVRKILNESDSVIDPKVYGRCAREHVSRLVQEKMTVCGCAGRY